jgi:hypothetical protein
MSAALCAARHHKNVLLVERYGFLGGSATAALVHHWDPIGLMESSGVIVEVYHRLKADGHLVDFDKTGVEMPFAYWEGGSGYDPEAYKQVWLDMLQQAGVTLLLHSCMVEATVNSHTITSIKVYNKGGYHDITAAIFIDATGDGDLLAYSGCAHAIGDEQGNCMSPTLAFRLGGVDTEKIYQYFDENPQEFGNHPRLGSYMRDWRHSAIIQGFYSLIKQATANGDLTVALPEPGIGMTIQPRYGEFHVNATRTPGMNHLDGWDLTTLERVEREKVWQVYRFIKHYIPGCADSYIMQTGDQVGIRESRRLVGSYVMQLEDIRQGTIFDDRIVRAKWAHCDVHSGKNMQWSFSFIEGPFYIPLRSLLPIEIKNLLVAGRCISASREVLSSLRIQPIGAAMGQAAGTAAALTIDGGTLLEELSWKKLQDALRSDGVVL